MSETWDDDLSDDLSDDFKSSAIFQLDPNFL